MESCQASSSNVVASAPFDHVKTLCEDSVYLFHEPVEQRPEVEIVFIHGLQLSGDSKKAYFNTWLARGGAPNNCWPSTWLAGKFPNSRILSISYDASAFKSARGKDGLILVGREASARDGFGWSWHWPICPVMFVCHSLGV